MAACSTTTKIDQAKLQSGIVDKGKEGGLTITSVDCPKDQDAKKDAAFTCTAALDSGQTVTVKVTGDDDKGNVTVALLETVLDGTKFGPGEAKILSADYSTTITVDCPAVIVTKNGATFTCKATDPTGDTRTVTFTSKNTDTNDYSYSVEGLPAANSSSDSSTTAAP